MAGAWPFLLLGLAAAFMVVSAFGTADPFSRTVDELDEDDPEFVDCITSGGDCLPFDVARDLGDLVTFAGVDLDPMVRAFLLAIIFVPLILGLLGAVVGALT